MYKLYEYPFTICQEIQLRAAKLFDFKQQHRRRSADTIRIQKRYGGIRSSNSF